MAEFCRLRPELEKLPFRMTDLPVDRGYPVPWFVEWVDGPDGNKVPEFRAMSPEKWVAAVKHKLCWVCGKRLGSRLAFAIGPMCGVNRVSSEPPCHLECAEWSARNCPFLSRPNMVRRDASDLPMVEPAGFMVQRNPGVTLIWVTRDYEIFKAGAGFLLQIGDPESLSFWAEGRPATRAQIDASIESGLPILLEKTQSQSEIAEIQVAVSKLRELLPA